MAATETNSISLWTCLHDGTVTNISSDLAARLLTIEIAVPFHWAFHKLPPETRFSIISEEVSVAEVLSFQPWPLAVEPPSEIAWKDAQVIRLENWKKGRLSSCDWSEFVATVNGEQEWMVLHAELISSPGERLLRMELVSNPSSDYRKLRVHAPRTRLLVGETEYSVEEFQDFGEAYWKAWAAKSEKDLQTEKKDEASKNV